VAAALLKLFGWRVLFQGLPAAQGVLVVYPHTSNWDFPVLVLAKWSVGLHLTFWGKDTLFRWPLFGRWLRWLGGLPVARDKPQGAVGQMAEALRTARDQGRYMWLGLSPEGTRRRTEGWRSGFYRVALQAGVPLGVVALDFGRREVRFQHFWELCGRPDEDIAAIATALVGCRGKRPELAAPIRLL
jgi:1-acyl-sn-glycerol-3-phosphate acyltransferase